MHSSVASHLSLQERQQGKHSTLTKATPANLPPVCHLTLARPQVLDAFLRLHGSEEGGAFFLGGTYSVAEVYTTSFVQRALACLPAYRNVDLRAVVKEHKLDRCVRMWLWSGCGDRLGEPPACRCKPAC